MPGENKNAFNTNGGISSDFGFVYQRLVFIKTLIDNCFNLSDSFEYEGIDDVSFSSQEEKIYSILFKRIVVQCKTGSLNYDIFLKMFENWLLIDNQDEYVLFSENDIDFEYDLIKVKEDIKNNVARYMELTKRKSKKSILWQLANKYGFKGGVFSNNTIDLKIDFVFNNFKNPIVMNYETIIEKSKESFIENRVYDCKDNKTICDRRFEYMLSRINTLINNNESKRIKTIINYSDFNKIIQNAISEINENKPYLKDYVDFKEKNYIRIREDNTIMNSFEGRFLKKVFGDDRLVITYLVFEYYYRDLRNNYIENNENDRVDYAETTAYENYLETEKNDNLRDYFNRVVNKEIKSPIIVNSQYQKGCYIFLSSESYDGECFIDWGVING